jgi:elongator complex protein 3
MVPVGDEPRQEYQHLGYGERLLTEAEGVSRAMGKTKILVTSGLGTRHYYSRLGYSPDGPYMAKAL